MIKAISQQVVDVQPAELASYVEQLSRMGWEVTAAFPCGPVTTVISKQLHFVDNPEWDGTDFAHPAWWRGNDEGAERTIAVINRIMDNGQHGNFGSARLNALAKRINQWRDIIKDLTLTGN